MKEQIAALLRTGNWGGLVDAVRTGRKAWSRLIRALYLEDEFLGWQAVEGSGA
ncbi:MAG: hypothetical protein AB1776_02025 [Bacillota bacterium]